VKKNDSPPTRIVDLPEAAYLHKPGRTMNDKELSILDSYKAGASITSLVRRWALAPATVVRILGLDRERDAREISEAQSAFTRLRQVVTDARFDD
jgi:hypothetical protein